ncbi:MAG: heat-inducible transcription repressor HrcA [candidate division Zixibacteria bacterium]|nr:heat-inducible transcription repressor HrcA [candidate division Zixibacteria bacterium]
MLYPLQTERDKDILRHIVDRHVHTASPVGSHTLAKRSALGVSAATIRNTMVELEEAGYISRPHSSAGGIPTDKGYRYYVDTLLRPRPVSTSDRQHIQQDLEGGWNSVQEVLSHASQVLGMVCREVGVALAPRLYDGVFQRIELLPVAPRKVLLVLMLSSGLVRNIVAELDTDIPARTLTETARFLNERLSGNSLREIKRELDERLKDGPQSNRKVIQLFIQYTEYLFDFQQNEQVHFGGTTHIVSQPEFSTDSERLSRLLDFLEHRQTVARWLNERTVEDRVMVSIGQEHSRDEIRTCSVVTATYRIGDMTGVIGVIGPTRMPYPHMISIVGYTARVLNAIFA